MAHTRKRGRDPFRALRGEAPCTVAVLAAASDFGLMRTYRSFVFDDYTAYLRHVERLLRALAGQGVHTRVALFDPALFERYCGAEQLDPDTAESRTHYTAEVAAGGLTLPYRGQRVDDLLPLLRDHRARRLTWDEASGLLARADQGGRRDRDGRDDGGGRGAGTAALARAGEAVTGILAAVGPGTHHLVCSVSTPGGPLLAAVYAECAADATPRWEETDALLLCQVLGAGFATGSAGGLVVRSGPPSGRGAPAGGGSGGAVRGGQEVVRGWRVAGGRLVPLTEAEVFSAYCTDADTGEPVPPEPGLRYRAGIPLPPFGAGGVNRGGGGEGGPDADG